MGTRTNRAAAIIVSVCVLGSVADSASGQDLYENLVGNPDAETGDTDRWSGSSQVQARASDAAGDLGLPPEEDLGDFCFHGGQSESGPDSDTVTQLLDLRAFADRIDTGRATAFVRGLIQSRRDGTTFDEASVSLEFQDESGAPLQSAVFRDDVAIDGVHDWHVFESSILIPPATRQIEIAMTFERDIGGSTDGFVDNLRLAVGCEADLDLDGDADSDDFFLYLDLFASDDGRADIDGNGAIDSDDFFGYLDQFAAGCN